jgi:hypothetical protein
MEVSITLTVQEVNALLGMLGQMPNSSGTYPLLVKIKEQGQAQLQQTEVVPPAPVPV